MTELFEAIVVLGADPQWVLYDLRLSMYDVVMRALARRQREEWERTRVATIIGAQASGARLKWDDLPNPYDAPDKQQANTSDIEAARKRLKELKKKANESD